MKFEIANVAIKKIEINDIIFKITTKNDIEDLKISISQNGLLSYPYLLKRENKYRVVSGFRRIIACYDLGYETISAKVLSKTTPQLQCAKIAIIDNTFQRELNIIEKSRCYHILKVSMINSTQKKDLSASLGLPVSESAFEKIEPVYFLSRSIQRGLLEGYISLPVALKLGDMKVYEIDVFVQIFKVLNTTLNNQREIIELITEISLRDDISVLTLSRNKVMEEIIHDNSNASQKTNRLRSYLKKYRYPRVTQVFDAFKKRLEQLKLNKRVKLNPPKFFEGSSYNVNITFDSSEELSSYKEDLEKIINDATLLDSFLKNEKFLS